ncbi:Hypothetical Protein FCC1311_091292 [Hondaea fermentalgiana]|uniref:Uncharacterized protein n=1 Tax=Hondaea fermentalgiana TaxID=2315210 RepID=A0A2R5GW58_9STRA|nr:Hypothetical Protein FCC1311_091292 [Hondaea fermentalgiana]|eukprot:GBG32903.1 Hypothetical Protein FCC1311_091292 [Hondaea fermentalgiana]
MMGLGDGFDPSGALEDKDAAGELLGVLAFLMLLTGAYHWHMASRAHQAAAQDPEGVENVGFKTPASAMSRDEGLSSDPDDSHAEMLAARKRQNQLECDFWSTVSPLDLRHGSHVGVISRFTLGLYRLGVVAYCITMWVYFFRDKSCCDDLEYIEPWTFVLYTLYFVMATFVSIKNPRRDGTVARYEVVMVCLYEVAFPMSLFLCFTYWIFLDRGTHFDFPSPHRPLMRIFASLNAALMLIEWSMNRIVLHSSRWMWVSYLCTAYLFAMLVIEKLKGKAYLVYSDAHFLPLELESYPKLIATLMSVIATYYFSCLLVTLRQYAWTSPLLHPIEGAVRLRPTEEARHEDERMLEGSNAYEDGNGLGAAEGRTGASASAATANAETPLLSEG